MDQKILAACQELEDKAHFAAMIKATEAWDLEQELIFVTDPAEMSLLRSKLRLAQKGSFKANTQLLKARIETAEAAKLLLAITVGVDRTMAFNDLIAPSFDNDISKAEDNLRRHLENEHRYYRK
jgi:ribonuclease I